MAGKMKPHVKGQRDGCRRILRTLNEIERSARIRMQKAQLCHGILSDEYAYAAAVYKEAKSFCDMNLYLWQRRAYDLKIDPPKRAADKLNDPEYRKNLW